MPQSQCQYPRYIRHKRPVFIPTGLIFGFRDTSLPSGWSWFTDPYDKYLVGAGDTYAVTDTGGTYALSGLTTSEAGGHSGTTFNIDNVGSSTAGGTAVAADDHSHTVGFSATPPYQGLRLIKLDSTGQEYLPANTVVFSKSNTAPSGLTGYYTDGYYFRPGATIATGGSNAAVTGWSSSTTSDHRHGSSSNRGIGPSGDYTYYKSVAAGGHTHTVSTAALTPNLKRVFLRAWSNASDVITATANIIGMYESITPPKGWFLCDGSMGTPDLRDRFVVMSDDGTLVNAGDDTLTYSITTNSTGSHNHRGDSVTSTTDIYERPTYHSDNVGAHSHTVTGTPSFQPPYYAIAFVMKA